MAQAPDHLQATQAAWWRGWLGEDYSWSGLARRPANRPRPGVATLQDYWRLDASGRVRGEAELRSAGELTDGPEGRVWHILHLPTAAAGLGATMKDQTDAPIWARVHEVVRERPDGALHLEGAVMLTLGRIFGRPGEGKPPIRIHAPRSAWVTHEAMRAHDVFADIDFSGAWLPYFSENQAVFEGEARFASAAFEYALFHLCEFRGPADFRGARFPWLARFNGAKFAAAADFRSTWWRGSAQMNCMRFAGPARFAGADFCNPLAVGPSDDVGVQFRLTQFEDAAEFDETKFSINWFNHLRFARGASFRRANFAMFACFDRCEFGGPARFDSMRSDGWARWGASVFADEAHFGGASFGGNVGFERSTFGAASFDNARFVALAGPEGVIPPDSALGWREALEGAFFGP